MHARLANTDDVVAADPRSFLCFQRRSEGDVILNNSKIGGSAQRRHCSALVQHGSVLLSKSRFAPQLPGVNDMSTATITIESLREGWLPRIVNRCGLTIDNNSPFTSLEHKQINTISHDRFSDKAWLRRR